MKFTFPTIFLFVFSSLYSLNVFGSTSCPNHYKLPSGEMICFESEPISPYKEILRNINVDGKYFKLDGLKKDQQKICEILSNRGFVKVLKKERRTNYIKLRSDHIKHKKSKIRRKAVFKDLLCGGANANERLTFKNNAIHLALKIVGEAKANLSILEEKIIARDIIKTIEKIEWRDFINLGSNKSITDYTFQKTRDTNQPIVKLSEVFYRLPNIGAATAIIQSALYVSCFRDDDLVVKSTKQILDLSPSSKGLILKTFGGTHIDESEFCGVLKLGVGFEEFEPLQFRKSKAWSDRFSTENVCQGDYKYPSNLTDFYK